MVIPLDCNYGLAHIYRQNTAHRVQALTGQKNRAAGIAADAMKPERLTHRVEPRANWARFQ